MGVVGWLLMLSVSFSRRRDRASVCVRVCVCLCVCVLLCAVICSKVFVAQVPHRWFEETVAFAILLSV